MPIIQKLAAVRRWLYDRLEALTHSYTLRFLRDFEPAFVVFTVIGVVIATVALWLDLSARQEERISRAWQTVSYSAPGNTGKADALGFLASMGQDLRWMHLAPGSITNDRIIDCSYRVFVPGLDLRGVQLDNANLSCSDLDSGDSDTRTARFDHASLHNTSWTRTKAERASFQSASLISADFRGARLGNANFENADLTQVKFAYADLRGASISGKFIAGLSIFRADLRGLVGLNCSDLRATDDWQSTCRDARLECGTPSETLCGPDAIPLELRNSISPIAGTTQSTAAIQPDPPECNAVQIQREIAFRLDQVDQVVEKHVVIDRGNASSSCVRARMIYVVAKLGGISRRPPPKEDETVWIGGSGFGYRHTPFKTGTRSEQFSSFSLPELVTDYLSCTSNDQTSELEALRSEVDTFEATAGSHVAQVKACDNQWIDNATEAWTSVRKTARKLSSVEK